MRRLAVGLFVLVVLFAACGGDGDGDKKPAGAGQRSTVEQGKDLATVAAGRLTGCVLAPNAPFAFDEGGQLQGIDVDVVNAVAGRLGLTAEVVRSTDVAADVRSGKCDIGTSSTVLDEEGFVFTAPYFEVHEALLVRAGDETRYGGFEALRGKPVGFPFTPAALVYATDYGNDVARKDYRTQADAVAALAAKQVEAVVVDEAVARHQAMTGGGETVIGAVLDPDEPIDTLAFLVPASKAPLKAAVDQALAQVRGDDTFRTILTNHLGSTAGQI